MEMALKRAGKDGDWKELWWQDATYYKSYN